MMAYRLDLEKNGLKWWEGRRRKREGEGGKRRGGREKKTSEKEFQDVKRSEEERMERKGKWEWADGR